MSKQIVFPGYCDFGCSFSRAQCDEGLPAPSEAELHQHISQLRDAEALRLRQHEERAAQLWEDLKTDPQQVSGVLTKCLKYSKVNFPIISNYRGVWFLNTFLPSSQLLCLHIIESPEVRWTRIRKLWEMSGQDLWEEYERLDRMQGEDRRHHGGDFEMMDARLAASLAVLSTKDEDLLGLKLLRGCEWRDGKQRLHGEVDIVVLGETGVIAMVEMKTGWFELPVALLLQHSSKCTEALKGDLNLYCGSQALPLKQTPPLFVATLIPPNPFVIGLDPELLRTICKALFSGACFIYNLQ